MESILLGIVPQSRFSGGQVAQEIVAYQMVRLHNPVIGVKPISWVAQKKSRNFSPAFIPILSGEIGSIMLRWRGVSPCAESGPLTRVQPA
jgi:hypothetical protein